MLPEKNENPYQDGVDWLMAAGVARPTEDRVLLRAILKTDGATIHIAGTDTLQAVCHEVVALGPECKGSVKVGDHVIHISAAADAADFLNPNARYLFVRERHIVASWDPGDAVAMFAKLQAEKSHR